MTLGPRRARTAMYCETCHAWRPVMTDAMEEGDQPAPDDAPWCAQCSEPFQCGECGYEVNAAGECQRPADLGACSG